LFGAREASRDRSIARERERERERERRGRGRERSRALAYKLSLEHLERLVGGDQGS